MKMSYKMKNSELLDRIKKLEEELKRVRVIASQALDRAHMNNLRTLMMIEHGDFPTLDGREKIDD